MLKVIQERDTVFTEIRTAVRHATIYGVGSIAMKAIGFLMLPFYTHYLSVRDYGLLEILDLSMSLLGMVLHMGIAPALLRSYAAAKTLSEKRTTVSTAFLFVLGTGLFILAGGLFVVKPLSAWLLGPSVTSSYLLLSFVSFILTYIGAMPRAYLRAKEASGTFTLIETGGLCGMLVLNVYFIAVLKLGPVGILLSALVVNALCTIALSIWTAATVGLSFSQQHLRHMVAFGLPLIFSNVALFALNFSDRFFLQRLFSLDVVGIYAVGYKLAFMMNYLLVQPFFTMWQARMYEIYKLPEHPRVFGQIFVLYSLCLTYAALALALFSRDIISVMADRKFAGSADIVPIVSLAYVWYGLGYYLQLGMFLTNKTKAIGGVSAVAAVLNLGLNYVLIGRYGMIGAAWATLLSFLAIAVGSYWFSLRTLPLQFGLRRVTASIALAGALYFGCVQVAGNLGILTLALKGATLLVFPVLVWKLRILSPGEVVTLVSAREKTTASLNRRLAALSGR